MVSEEGDVTRIRTLSQELAAPVEKTYDADWPDWLMGMKMPPCPVSTAKDKLLKELLTRIEHLTVPL
jgi:hypothetical protein